MTSTAPTEPRCDACGTDTDAPTRPCVHCAVDVYVCPGCAQAQEDDPAPYVCSFCRRVQGRPAADDEDDAEPLPEPLDEEDGIEEPPEGEEDWT